MSKNVAIRMIEYNPEFCMVGQKMENPDFNLSN
jgi:hypothetical protein